METLWQLEDKWKLSTQAAAFLFVCTASLLLGMCTATVLKRRASSARKSRLIEQDPPVKPKWSGAGCACGWGGSLKRALMATVRWSGASKWEERNVATWQEGLSPSPLVGRAGEGLSPSPLVGRAREGLVGPVGWQSHNSDSPVWQRPILMGEKCELPRFSGLILYDERGLPLHNESGIIADVKPEFFSKEKSPPTARTTLRDLL